jgi:hypothetical protein
VLRRLMGLRVLAFASPFLIAVASSALSSSDAGTTVPGNRLSGSVSFPVRYAHSIVMRSKWPEYQYEGTGPQIVLSDTCSLGRLDGARIIFAVNSPDDGGTPITVGTYTRGYPGAGPRFVLPMFFIEYFPDGGVLRQLGATSATVTLDEVTFDGGDYATSGQISAVFADRDGGSANIAGTFAVRSGRPQCGPP